MSGGTICGIIVCGRRDIPPPRLPLPDERHDPGEAEHHIGEPRKANEALSATSGHCGPTSCSPPQRLGETMGKLFGLLREAVTGEDPDQP